MLPIFKYPHSSYQQINFDWIMKTIGKLKAAIPMVEEAQTVYESAIAALDGATAAVTEATEKANAAEASASAAQYSAAVAQQQATYAATDASAANANAQAASTTAQAASTAAQDAEDAATEAYQQAEAAFSVATTAAQSTVWGFVEQLAINPPSVSDVTSAPIDVTSAKSILLQVVDTSNYYGGEVTIIIPGMALRGMIPNYTLSQGRTIALPNTNSSHVIWITTVLSTDSSYTPPRNILTVRLRYYRGEENTVYLNIYRT